MAIETRRPRAVSAKAGSGRKIHQIAAAPLALVLKLAAVAVLATQLQACKVQIEVPRGGKVVSESGTYSCQPNSTCEIDVVDQFFSETFTAVPNPGWVFRRWARVPSAFCGDRLEPCALSTAGLDLFPKLFAILESDQVFYLKPVFEPVPQIHPEDLQTVGDVVNTDDGFDLSGSLRLTTGDGGDREFRDSNLEVGFNAKGDLEKLDGEGILPRNLTRGFTLEAGVRADIGFYSGAEINANDDIAIHLVDERRYFVLLIGADTSYTYQQMVPDKDFKPRAKTVETKINTPAGGKILMILDPNDDMIYRYGETPLLGAFGEATSDQGLLPYVPTVEGNTKVYRFDGHQYKTISVGVGIKALDLLNLEGEQVTWQPSLFDIDLSDPFDSNIAYRAGFNGAAQVAISVFGFSVDDTFDFDLAEASASFEAGTKRQVMTLAAELEPQLKWIPDWFPLVPSGRLAFDLTATGKGSVVFNIAGEYHSVLPEADLEGSMRITPRAVTLKGVVPGSLALPVTLRFEDGDTFGTVGITRDFSDQVRAQVDRGFDRAEQEVADAIAQLQQAASDYEFELSLRGLREVLPAVADKAVEEMNKVPDIVYSAVYKAVKDGIDAKNKCVLGVCAVSTSTRNSVAKSAATDARNQAVNRLKPYIAAVKELKRSALEDDSPELVATLENALRQAYAYRSISEKITVTVEISIPGPNIKVTKSYTITRTVLTSSQASAVLTAANNVHLIPETSDKVVSAQEIVDRLPTDDIIKQARQSVADETAAIPAVTAVNYTIADGKYSAAVQFSDGSQYDMTLNALDWRALTEGIGDLLAGFVIEKF